MPGVQYIADEPVSKIKTSPLTSVGRDRNGHEAIAEAYAGLAAQRNELRSQHGDRVVFETPTMALTSKFHDYEVWVAQEYTISRLEEESGHEPKGV